MQKNNNIYHNKQRQNILWLEYMSYIFYILELLYIIYSIYTTYQNYQNIIFYNGKGDIIWRFHCHTYFRCYIYENFFLLVYLDKWVFFVTSLAINCPGIYFGEQAGCKLPESHMFLHPRAGIRNPCYYFQSSLQLIS